MTPRTTADPGAAGGEALRGALAKQFYIRFVCDDLGCDEAIPAAEWDRTDDLEACFAAFFVDAETFMASGPLADLLARAERADAAERERDEAIAAAEKAEGEAEDLRTAPWPEWAETILRAIRKESGNDGFDDDSEGVDLPAELDDLIGELHHQQKGHRTAAHRAKAVEAETARLTERLAALEAEIAALRAREDGRGETGSAEAMREACIKAAQGCFVPMDASAQSAAVERGIDLAVAAIRVVPARADARDPARDPDHPQDRPERGGGR